MKPVTVINGYTILSAGCCGSQIFAVARPNNTIMKRDFFTEEDATNYIASITNINDRDGLKEFHDLFVKGMDYELIKEMESRSKNI